MPGAGDVPLRLLRNLATEQTPVNQTATTGSAPSTHASPLRPSSPLPPPQ
ncbi:hypothetical protein Pd630_LPD16114 (plasmid) [Rhodococcus opacus PD630]|nr:hypothetical protein Pd630_LPD16114 [Rhodococcus opacus PD630]